MSVFYNFGITLRTNFCIPVLWKWYHVKLHFMMYKNIENEALDVGWFSSVAAGGVNGTMYHLLNFCLLLLLLGIATLTYHTHFCLRHLYAIETKLTRRSNSHQVSYWFDSPHSTLFCYLLTIDIVIIFIQHYIQWLYYI